MKQPNAYIVGEAHSHDAALRQAQPLIKKGRYQNELKTFEGTIVFRNLQEAECYIEGLSPELSYKVYGLVLPTGWEEDVQDKRPNEPFHRLRNDALVISLEKRP